MLNIAIFASGAGSNADKIIRYFKEEVEHAQIKLIICNNGQAGVKQVASQQSIPFYFFDNTSVNQGEDLSQFLLKEGIDWIVLAGFLRKISTAILEKFSNRIINIHPSLLPKFGGVGMYGNKVHQAVFNEKESESGISIHLVNEEYDQGKILFQAKTTLKKEDQVEDIKLKVQQLEYLHYPRVIAETILKN